MENYRDDFLKDLQDLLEDENEEQKVEGIEDLDDNEDEMGQNEAVDVTEEITDKDRIQRRKGQSNLLSDSTFLRHMEKLDKYSKKSQENVMAGSSDIVDEEEYQLIVKSTEYVSIVDREIANIHKFVMDIYIQQFPELETLVLNPLDYVKVVMTIKNETDMNIINFTNILNPQLVMAVTLAGSSTSGKPLSEKDLQRCLDACELVLRLDEIKRNILLYIESRMYHIAPNLCEVTGPTVAAGLIAAAGGLEALNRIPACNIQVFGTQRKNLLGFSKVGQNSHLGLFGQMEMVKNAPKDFQIKLVRLLSTNCAKAVHADYARTCPDGSIGKQIKAKMLARFDKIQEPQAPKMKKPLPAPDDKPKKRRGGKRYRKMKEKMQSALRSEVNKLKFGEEGEDEYRESGVGFGMLGRSGIGKVKVKVKNDKINLSKKQQADLSRNMGGQTGGYTSSIVMTPTQGMQLYNPDFVKKATASKADNYFSKESGFTTVIRTKQQNGINLSMNPPPKKQ